jgi:hypothetical protein
MSSLPPPDDGAEEGIMGKLLDLTVSSINNFQTKLNILHTQWPSECGP